MQKPSHILAILFLLTVASLASQKGKYLAIISGDIEPTINQNNDQLPVQKQVPKNDKVDPILNVDGIPNIVEETIKLDEHGKVIQPEKAQKASKIPQKKSAKLATKPIVEKNVDTSDILSKQVKPLPEKDQSFQLKSVEMNKLSQQAEQSPAYDILGNPYAESETQLSKIYLGQGTNIDGEADQKNDPSSENQVFDLQEQNQVVEEIYVVNGSGEQTNVKEEAPSQKDDSVIQTQQANDMQSSEQKQSTETQNQPTSSNAEMNNEVKPIESQEVLPEEAAGSNDVDIQQNQETVQQVENVQNQPSQQTVTTPITNQQTETDNMQAQQSEQTITTPIATNQQEQEQQQTVAAPIAKQLTETNQQEQQSQQTITAPIAKQLTETNQQEQEVQQPVTVSIATNQQQQTIAAPIAKQLTETNQQQQEQQQTATIAQQEQEVQQPVADPIAQPLTETDDMQEEPLLEDVEQQQDISVSDKNVQASSDTQASSEANKDQAPQKKKGEESYQLFEIPSMMIQKNLGKSKQQRPAHKRSKNQQ